MVLNNVDNIMVGSNEVDKIYCGSNVIWERESSILPAGYTQKEYLQTSGEQVINTEYTPQTDVLRIEMRILYQLQQYKVFIDSRLISLWAQTSILDLWTDTNRNGLYSNAAIITMTSDEIYDIIIEHNTTNKILKINDVEFSDTNVTQIADTNNPIYLLAGKYSNAQPISNFDYFYTGRMYYCKIWDNDILVRDFIPAVRDSDGKVGFYDLVTNQFYTNAGTGADFTTN